MDTWEQLTTNSTILVGDAWEHLLHQSGEGTGPGGLRLVDTFEMEIVESTISIELEPSIDVTLEEDE